MSTYQLHIYIGELVLPNLLACRHFWTAKEGGGKISKGNVKGKVKNEKQDLSRYTDTTIYLSTREAKGCTRREVPMTMRRSHLFMSSLTQVANLSGSASPKNTMSAVVYICSVCECTVARITNLESFSFAVKERKMVE